jgi:hypothetical protein
MYESRGRRPDGPQPSHHRFSPAQRFRKLDTRTQFATLDLDSASGSVPPEGIWAISPVRFQQLLRCIGAATHIHPGDVVLHGDAAGNVPRTHAAYLTIFTERPRLSGERDARRSTRTLPPGSLSSPSTGTPRECIGDAPQSQGDPALRRNSVVAAPTADCGYLQPSVQWTRYRTPRARQRACSCSIASDGRSGSLSRASAASRSSAIATPAPSSANLPSHLTAARS